MKIYTDGSCNLNTGKGGWAFVVVENDIVKHEESGGELYTTNNKMELTAIIKALEYAPEGVSIYSDSEYCVKSITTWYKSWVGTNKIFKKKNVDLIKRAVSLVLQKKAKLQWVRGHSGQMFNEIADSLCDYQIHHNKKA